MGNWRDVLNADPLPWLLDDKDPAVKHLALCQLLGRPADDPEVASSRRAAMGTGPIAAILAAQAPEGFWVKPGAGYGPKYRGTVWQLIFLDQLGADPADPRVRAACEYVLSHTQAESGGFAASAVAKEVSPSPSYVIHCLNGNLVRALLGFGWEGDLRLQRAVDWQARAITGEGPIRFYQSGTNGPGFCCSANEKLPCAWGAVKAMLGLARIPAERRAPHVQRAVEEGAAFLLSCDPAKADYPLAWGNTKPNGSWFKLGFPSGYVTDVLQNLAALCELGYAHDDRLANATRWLLGKQDGEGRWRNEYSYHGKMWVDVEKQGAPSKWVTLRACRVLKAVYGP
ncbi:MAG: nitrogen fixation protein NifH [Dehalococcoidales bacterium]|nr:nitrogen fixation protein NifH [Dehalococcoidales bacterium]